MDPITQRLTRIAEELTAKRQELAELYNELTTADPAARLIRTTRSRAQSIGYALNRLCDAADELKDAQEITT